MRHNSEKIWHDPETDEVRLHSQDRDGRTMNANVARGVASDVQRMGREALVAAMQRSNPAIGMQAFADVYPPEKIASDQRYVSKAERFLSKDEQNNLATAQVFESLFNNGIVLGNWLGNVVFENDDVTENFSVDARSTLPYDDFRNRNDTFATLRFREPIEDEDFGTSTDEVVLGFDVTINNSRNKLLDKITRFYNGDQELPFGFSHLEYYSNYKEHGNAPLVPRYTIGLSASDVNAVVETAHTRERDGTVDFGLFTGQNLINRFKVLSEIRAENELYQAMLPDDMDSEIVQQANIQLYAADQCLHDALDICTEELVNRKCLPAKVIADVEAAKQKGRNVQARNIVQKYLLQRSREIFDSESKERVLRGKEQLGDGDTFVQIIQLCNELKDAAYAGELDEFRNVGIHNKGITAHYLAQNVA